MSQSPKPSPVTVGKDGFVYADGVKFGRYVKERQTVAIKDQDRRRCLVKGREVVEIRISDLVNLTEKK